MQKRRIKNLKVGKINKVSKPRVGQSRGKEKKHK